MQKNKILILLILMSISVISYGQQNKFEIGIEAGMNLSTLRNNNYFNLPATFKPGVSAGVTAQYFFTPKIALQGGIFSESKGCVLNIDQGMLGTPETNDNAKVILNYLVIPLQTRFYFGNKVKFFGQVGLYGGYLFHAKVIYDPGSSLTIRETDLTDLNKKLDFGVLAGMGVRYPIGDKLALVFEIKENFGVQNISKDIPNEDGGVKNSSLNLSFGISYPVGR